jgi:transposase
MARPILDDNLSALIEPFLPPPKPRRSGHPGRKPLDNRAVLTGILFVLQTGLRWDLLPQEMGCGSGMSCWRRLRDWQAAGVWDELHEVLLARGRPDRLVPGHRRLLFNPCHGRWSITGPNPTDRARPGSNTTSLPKRWHPARGYPDGREPQRCYLSFMHWLMPSCRSAANAADHYRNRASFRATEATITTNTAVRSMLPALQLK